MGVYFCLCFLHAASFILILEYYCQIDKISIKDYLLLTYSSRILFLSQGDIERLTDFFFLVSLQSQQNEGLLFLRLRIRID